MQAANAGLARTEKTAGAATESVGAAEVLLALDPQMSGHVEPGEHSSWTL